MTEKTEKPKLYFGIVPKEELPGFLERLKKAVAEGQKSGDKKELNIEIRGSKEDPKGFSIENFTIDKTKFAEFFDPDAEHTKKALVLCTVNLELKDEKDLDKVKGAFEMVKPMVMELPFVKKRPGKFDLLFRNKGTKVAVDFVSLEGKIIQPLLDLGIDLAEFHKFSFALKTGADLGKIYTEGATPSDELITDLLNVLVSVKSSGENVKFLTTALVAALKDVKLGNEKYQKKLEKMLGFLNLINSFISGTIKFEYDAKVLKGEGEKSVEQKVPGGAEGFKRQLSGYHGMATSLGQQMVKPAVEGMGFTDTLKSLNLDKISIAAGVPKYQNGCALVLTVPGLSKVLEELLK